MRAVLRRGRRARRSQTTNSLTRTAVNQLLTELDGVDGRNEDVFVLAATNQPWDVDPAMRRPGRLDRAVLVLPPDESTRAAIFTYHLRDRPLAGGDVPALARASEGLSGADIAMAPNDIRTHLQRVNVDTTTRRLTKAGRASAQTALRLAPNSPAAHVAIGNVEFARRRVKQAKASYAEALRLDPTNRAAQYNLALISQRFGSSTQAIKVALGLIRVDPANPNYVLLLRRSMMGALISALLGSAVAALFITPGPGAGASSTQAGVVLATCLVLQAGALLWLRLKVGRPAMRVLMPTGGLRWPMRVGIGMALLADLCVVLAFVSAPSDDAEALGALAMILFLLSISGVALTAGIRGR